MASIRQINSSRENGALSHGPVTEDGKRRSSRNAVRHGLLSVCVVLDSEAQDGYDELFDDHTERFQPKDALEMGLIEKMATTDWKMRCLWALENRMFNDQINSPDFDGHDTELDRMVAALARLAESKSYHLLQRYEARLDRMYQRSIRNFTHVRDKVAPVELPNEPA